MMTSNHTAVIALGGNALAPSGEVSTIYDQFRHARESLGPIVELALSGWNVCIVHGNGPQVGDELVRNEVARGEASPLPLGVLVAATAGWIGYMIQQTIENALARAGSPRSVATIITQVEIDPTDPAPVVEGQLAIDLFSIPGMWRSPRTNFIWAFSGDMASEPATVAFVSEAMLQQPR